MIEKKRLKILLSAFACEPNKGSERGVGWNFAKNMAIHHDVWVLTRTIQKKQIEEELSKNPVPGLSFLYYDIPLSSLINEKILGEQIHYISWQLCVIKTYKNAAKLIDFDLVHHLTYNQYRSPSVGFFIKKPFILGPIGGAETINPVFFQDLGFISKVKEKWRIAGLDLIFFEMLCNANNNKKKIVFSSAQNMERIKKHLRKQDTYEVVPAIAINKNDFEQYGHEKIISVDKPFTIVYSGIAKNWKGLLILLQAIKKAFQNQSNISVKLIGIRNEEEHQKVSKWIYDCGLTDKVEIIKFMPRVQVIDALSSADLSVYPAFRDSGSMSVLEALALGCTVLCFDAGGQDVFPNEILIKLPVSDTSYQTNLSNLSNRLSWCYNHRVESSEIGKKARSYVLNHYTWEQKAVVFSKLYNDLLNQ